MTNMSSIPIPSMRKGRMSFILLWKSPMCNVHCQPKGCGQAHQDVGDSCDRKPCSLFYGVQLAKVDQDLDEDEDIACGKGVAVASKASADQIIETS